MRCASSIPLILSLSFSHPLMVPFSAASLLSSAGWHLAISRSLSRLSRAAGYVITAFETREPMMLSNSLPIEFLLQEFSIPFRRFFSLSILPFSFLSFSPFLFVHIFSNFSSSRSCSTRNGFATEGRRDKSERKKNSLG